MEAEDRPPDAPLRLILRCLIEARCGGSAQAPEDLPPELLSRLGAAMAERDPRADIRVGLDCPACSHAWSIGFDIVSYLLGELDDWAERTLAEVHTLARAYGWTEARHPPPEPDSAPALHRDGAGMSDFLADLIGRAEQRSPILQRRQRALFEPLTPWRALASSGPAEIPEEALAEEKATPPPATPCRPTASTHSPRHRRTLETPGGGTLARRSSRPRWRARAPLVPRLKRRHLRMSGSRRRNRGWRLLPFRGPFRPSRLCSTHGRSNRPSGLQHRSSPARPTVRHAIAREGDGAPRGTAPSAAHVCDGETGSCAGEHASRDREPDTTDRARTCGREARDRPDDRAGRRPRQGGAAEGGCGASRDRGSGAASRGGHDRPRRSSCRAAARAPASQG